MQEANAGLIIKGLDACIMLKGWATNRENKVLVYEGRYDIVAISDTWWDETYDWNIVLKEKETDSTKEGEELHHM